MRFIVAAAFTVFIGGCSKEPAPEPTPSCPIKLARSAAIREINPIMAAINNPSTRAAGCYALDNLIRDSAEISHFEDKPNSCDWGYGDNGPHGQVMLLLDPYGDTLAKLCDWKRKDAERALTKRGEAILDGMSPEDRATLERAYKGD